MSFWSQVLLSAVVTLLTLGAIHGLALWWKDDRK